LDVGRAVMLRFFLAYVVLLFGPNAALFLGAIYVLLLWISIQHGARVRHVQSIGRFLRPRVLADLSAVPRGLSQMRPVLFLLVGNHVRRVTARRFRAAARSSRPFGKSCLRSRP